MRLVKKIKHKRFVPLVFCIVNYFLSLFNLVCSLDFFLSAVFFLITPFCFALSIVFIAVFTISSAFASFTSIAFLVFFIKVFKLSFIFLLYISLFAPLRSSLSADLVLAI